MTEKLNRKPSQEDINKEGGFKVAKYLSVFGSWINFLKEIGELTESSYHFPQGTHLGHIMYILNVVGTNSVMTNRIAPQYVRFEKSKDDTTPLSTFQRQTKYKLQAAMEMGILVDFRSDAESGLSLLLTTEGKNLYYSLKPLLETLDMSFNDSGKTEISWAMNNESTINSTISAYLDKNSNAYNTMGKLLLNMDAIVLFMKYLYSIKRKTVLRKADVYAEFFKVPCVERYCEIHGINPPTDEGAKHRIPFLVNILECLGIVTQSRSEIQINYFVPTVGLMKLDEKESESITLERINKFKNKCLSEEDITMLKEIYGRDFYTEEYIFKIK